MVHDYFTERQWAQMMEVDGKGWTVKRARGKYGAYANYGQKKYKYYAQSSDFKEAARYAIAAAIKAKTIDWLKTKYWLELAGMSFDSDEILSATSKPKGQGYNRRGWSVCNVTTGGRLRNPMWQARVGKNIRHGQTVGHKGSQRMAIRMVLPIAKEMDCYGEAESIAYLHKIGMDDLVPLARRSA